MIIKKRIFLFITLLMVQCGFAQSGVRVTASLNKERILIGEAVQLKVEAFLPAGTTLIFPTIDSIEHFEFLETVAKDSTTGNTGVTIRAVYTLTSFDSGHWVIPAFQLAAGIKTDSLPIDVVFSDFNPGQDYHDIKDILEAAPAKKNLPWWWYVAGGILLLALLTWYFRNRKKATPVSVPEKLISPYEEAMKQLEQLEKDRPGVKLYHSRLTDIFRRYILRKKGIHSLQKTTDDLIIQLKELNLARQQFDQLTQSLRLSDFVKFAKYLPSGEDNENCFRDIKNTIMTIEKSEADSPSPGGS